MKTKPCLALVCAAACASVMARGLLAAPPQPPDPVGHRTIVLGRSVDGRLITAVETGDSDSPRKALVVGCIHGNECAGIAVAVRLARTPAPSETDLWILSDLNPDGASAGTRGNSRGVDLNRNFPWRWARLTGTYYSGSAPLSEPETRIAARLIARVRPAVSVWFHQHLNLVDDSSGSVAVERRFARAAGLRLAPLAPEPGSAVTWESHCFPQGSAFVVELPAGALAPTAVSRLARAVRAAAAVPSLRRPVRVCAVVP
jgi:murein peptide amidase A